MVALNQNLMLVINRNFSIDLEHSSINNVCCIFFQGFLFIYFLTVLVRILKLPDVGMSKTCQGKSMKGSETAYKIDHPIN